MASTLIKFAYLPDAIPVDATLLWGTK